nr:hypothetical protein precursor [uncultured bacterium]
MKSPFTGLPIAKNVALKRPIAVMVDGSKAALPQSGLQCASVVFSASVEGDIPRYMAVFLDEIPTKVGPIRSARPYYIDWACPYQPFYVHCGGSPKALERLWNEKGIVNIDYIYLINGKGRETEVSNYQFFHRTKDRKSPHNLYIDLQHFQKEVSKKSAIGELHSDIANFSAYESIPHDWTPKNVSLIHNLEITRKQLLNHKKKIFFNYSKKKQKFERLFYCEESKKWQPHMDQNTSDIISIDNLVVIETGHDVIKGDLKGRVMIKTLSRGKAWFCMNGFMTKGSWLKITADTAIRFFDLKGQRIKFKPGNIWIEVISRKEKVKILSASELSPQSH